MAVSIRQYALTDFLISLSDPEALSRYVREPEREMERAGLSDLQKVAVRERDDYRVRRYCALEMANESLHAKLLLRNYAEFDPDFKLSGLQIRDDAFPDVDHDEDVDTDHNIVQTTDLGDDIAEFSPRYSAGYFYDDLFSNCDAKARFENELTFVGTGIDGANHLTAEAQACIASADKVLYCVADLVIERRIRLLNGNTDDLYRFYGDNKLRRRTYEDMVEEILASLRTHRRVCAVFYGHPGIFVWPSYRAIQIARREGYGARMLPAVSSLDCLFSDVGFDPSRYSCQVVEATDLLVRRRVPDTGASVILFQVGCVGDLGYTSHGYDRRNVPLLADYLASFYGWNYEVILYEAAQYPVCDPRIRRIPISGLVEARPSGITTLYIPPKELPQIDDRMLHSLGLQRPEHRE